jgi:hypothetical protein
MAQVLARISDASLLCRVCKIVLLTLFSILASPGLQCTEWEEGRRAFGLILNSVLGGLYYDETRQPDLHLNSCLKLSPYSTVNTLCLYYKYRQANAVYCGKHTKTPKSTVWAVLWNASKWYNWLLLCCKGFIQHSIGCVEREGTRQGKSTLIQLVQRLRDQKVHITTITITTTTTISILCYVFALYTTFF